jgi:hypothetical protein
MKPRNFCTLVTFVGASHFLAFSTWVLSICTVPLWTLTPRNLIVGYLKVHFFWGGFFFSKSYVIMLTTLESRCVTMRL